MCLVQETLWTSPRQFQRWHGFLPLLIYPQQGLYLIHLWATPSPPQAPGKASLYPIARCHSVLSVCVDGPLCGLVMKGWVSWFLSNSICSPQPADWKPHLPQTPSPACLTTALIFTFADVCLSYRPQAQGFHLFHLLWYLRIKTRVYEIYDINIFHIHGLQHVLAQTEHLVSWHCWVTDTCPLLGEGAEPPEGGFPTMPQGLTVPLVVGDFMKDANRWVWAITSIPSPCGHANSLKIGSLKKK